MAHETISIRTMDGECPSHVFTPADGGSGPGAIFFMDGLGIRPILLEMGQRLADAGYVVLLPDLFYRAGGYDPIDPKTVFADPDARAAWGKLFASTDNRRAAEDSAAFLAYLGDRKDVSGEAVGVTGYCMGGAIALTVAGTYPDRIAAAASFHGGGLASDSPMSPHLLAPAMEAEVYVASAVQDEYFPPEMGERLESALIEAGVKHRCEFYDGALHGWTMKDTAVYDEAAAERHWRELIALFDRRLK